MDFWNKIFKKKTDTKNENLDLEIPREQISIKDQDQVLKKIKQRRSVRNFYRQKIPFEKIQEIIETGLTSPCAGNIQNYRIIIIDKYDLKEEISRCCKNQFFIIDAEYLLLILEDNQEIERIYPQKYKKYSRQNVAALTQTMLITAEILNLKTCWIQIFDKKDELKDLLQIPKNFDLDTIIAIGNSNQNPDVKKIGYTEIISYNKYGQKKKKPIKLHKFLNTKSENLYAKKIKTKN